MSDQIEDLVENLKQTSVWQRVFFTLGFALLFNVIIVPLVLLTVLVQVIFALLGGEKNERIAELSEQLLAYVGQLVRFLLFLTEQRPFPFSDFPEPTDSSSEDSQAKPTEEEGVSEAADDLAETAERDVAQPSASQASSGEFQTEAPSEDEPANESDQAGDPSTIRGSDS
mgnify:CR=1 FL=1